MSSAGDSDACTNVTRLSNRDGIGGMFCIAKMGLQKMAMADLAQKIYQSLHIAQ